jgi:genome maintenance exonuclease 1
MDMFRHIDTPAIGELKQINSPEGRRYETPDGKLYPSVTTVLGRLSAQAIQEWRNRVGEEKANAISTKAARRGTRVHQMCEDYLNNNNHLSRAMPIDVETFNTIKPILHNIDNISCQEKRLYSHHLGLAGTVDCIAEYNGKRSVIDFKTSLKPKKHEWVTNYFMQESAYAIMWEELTGQPITQLVTIIAVDDNEPQVFIEHRDTWVKPLRDAITDYMNSNT